MLPALIVTRLLKMALKGKLSEKAIKLIVTSLGDVLVKSTKNDLDDKLWAKVKEVLK
jgi:hypothetical protein